MTQRNVRILLWPLAALALTGGCKRKPDLHELSYGAYIVGASNDIKPFDGEPATLKELDPDAAAASVLVATKMGDKRVKFCSGTLIAGDRILSNHHCFAETDGEGKATRELLKEACTETRIYFGYLPGHAAQAWSTTCAAGSLRTNFEGDLSVFKLAGSPPDKYKPLALWDGDDTPTGRAAAIVHYPDVEERMELPPEGGAKLPTAAITLDDCQVQGAFAISEWDLDRTLPFSLRHTCDLIHGSSGSALIDLKTSTILGVNWGGIKITYDNGVRTDNVATRASYVKAFLEGKTDALVKSAETEKQRYGASALPKQDEDEGGLGKKSAGVVDTAKKAACGVAGGGTTEAALALILLGAIPALVAAAQESKKALARAKGRRK